MAYVYFKKSVVEVECQYLDEDRVEFVLNGFVWRYNTDLIFSTKQECIGYHANKILEKIEDLKYQIEQKELELEDLRSQK